MQQLYFSHVSYDEKTDEFVVHFVTGGVAEEYRINLKHCQTSAAVLDWIMQVSGKAWASDTLVADLVRAFREYLNPQAYLCSWGSERGPIDAVKIAKDRWQKKQDAVRSLMPTAAPALKGDK